MRRVANPAETWGVNLDAVVTVVKQHPRFRRNHLKHCECRGGVQQKPTMPWRRLLSTMLTPVQIAPLSQRSRENITESKDGTLPRHAKRLWRPATTTMPCRSHPQIPFRPATLPLIPRYPKGTKTNPLYGNPFDLVGGISITTPKQ